MVFDISSGQSACLLFFVYLTSLYGYAEFLEYIRKSRKKVHGSTTGMEDGALLQDLEEESKPALPSGKVMLMPLCYSTLLRALRLDVDALREVKPMLRNASEMGVLLAWFFLCDRSDLIASGEKSYSRDFFIFFMLLLTAVFLWVELHVSKCKAAPLNRDQTEEWKGWMQVMFLLYHYFEAKEMYNAIRLFIAAYVWMTGFGNFSYYYVRKDFTLGRFAHMMWRLNFFVFFCCLVLRNDYVLYYICPMHTIFTLFIYIVLGTLNQYNSSGMGIAIKFGACFAIVGILWEAPGVFRTVFRPLEPLVGYVDPRKPDIDPLHEWEFRSGLDRYIWIWGMACAFFHPRFERALNTLDEMKSRTTALCIRLIVIAACLGSGIVYYHQIYCLPKLEYNKVHPFTSWIPLTIFIVLRNITPNLRSVHIAKYAFLGKITLETYIAQFHIWLSTNNVPNGQPTKLLVLIPNYPLVNFILCTALYVFVSFRLFNVTNNLKLYLLPLNDNKSLLYNFSIFSGLFVSGLLVSLVMHTFVE